MLCACAGLILAATLTVAADRKPAAQRTINSRIDVPDHPRPDLLNGMEVRTIDGSNNNPDHPEWGMADRPLRRAVPPAYADGVSAPSGADRPNPRALSNAVLAQPGSTTESGGMTDMFWLWGQFIDHDIDLTEVADPVEHFPIPVPAGDPWFDPDNTGAQEMAFERSAWMPGTGTGPGNPRRQVNNITTWLDGSMIYGSDPVRADALRANDGTGRLKTSAGNLLPFNEPGLPNGGGTSADLFLAGDVRANENVLLTTMHTIWMREHNRLADEIASQNPSLSGDQVYEEARARVGAMLQVITYNEFLPILLGPDALPPYDGYDDDLDPRIANVFSTAAYRLGHSMVRQRYSHNRVFPDTGFDLLFGFSGLSGQIIGDLAPENPTAPLPVARLPSNWIIDWRRFHELDRPSGVPLNASRRIDPRLVDTLHTLFRTDAWKKTARQHGLVPIWRGGDDFEGFVRESAEKMETISREIGVIQ